MVWSSKFLQPLLQAGGHGTCITQCRSAKIVTSKTIPMQVDGEACKLNPSIINLSLLNKAPMLSKRKCGKPNVPQTPLDNLKICVHRIGMVDYEQHHYDKDLLTQAGKSRVLRRWGLQNWKTCFCSDKYRHDRGESGVGFGASESADQQIHRRFQRASEDVPRVVFLGLWVSAVTIDCLR